MRRTRENAAAMLLLTLVLPNCGDGGALGTIESISLVHPAPSGGAAGALGGAGSGGAGAEQGGASGTKPPMPAKPGVEGEGWTQHLHDPTHTGRTTATIATSPKIAWKRALADSSPNGMSPLVDPEGNVYVAPYGKLFSFTRDGVPRWTHPAQTPPPGSPWTPHIAGVAILPGGTVATVEDAPPTVHLLDQSGLDKLVIPLPAVPLPSLPSGAAPLVVVGEPTVGHDGTLFIVVAHASSSTYVNIAVIHRLSASGELLGSSPLGDTQASDVTQAPDGSLYVVVGSQITPYSLFKLDLEGKTSWSLPLESGGYAPTISPSGQLWLTLRGAKKGVMGVTAQGEVLFSQDVSWVLTSPPLLDLQGNAFISGACSAMSFDPTGAKRWQAPCGDDPLDVLHVWAEPALSADGTLVVLDSSGSLHGLLDGKDRWSVKLDGGAKSKAVFGSVAIGPDGTIYAGGVSGTLFALR